MMRVPHGSLARSPKPRREHGRHIFAYCNVNTNQVLYSLTQVLKGNSSLKQLPDAGANNNPPKLRKDLWRPLWTVTLPDGKDGLRQGLHTFKKLCEFRKQHELNWQPPPELARPTSEEEIDEIKKHLEDRGGKKVENAYDIVKRRKKKIRQRMVMDQKANSIADLAAVLIAQDSIGATTAESKAVLLEEQRVSEVAEMLKLANEVNGGGLGKIEAQILQLQVRRHAKKEGKNDEEKSNRHLIRSIRALEKQRRRMRFSASAVAAANKGMTLLPDGQTTVQQADAMVRQQVRALKEDIRARREAGKAVDMKMYKALSDEQPRDELAWEKEILEPQAHAATTAESPKMFHHSSKELALELEMIRRLHGRPERVEKALGAYTPRPRDVRRLRSLAEHWRSTFQKALQRYEAELSNWKELQAAVDRGEEAITQFFLANGNQTHPRTPSGEIDVKVLHDRTPARMARIQAVEEVISLLQGLLRLMGDSDSVSGAEAMILEYQAAHPTSRAEFVLKPWERGSGSQLKVMGPDRGYATVLAKAKVEARAAELMQEIKENANEKLTGTDTGLEGTETAEVEADAEHLAEPTREELREAVKQIRRLSARVREIEDAPAYRDALKSLSEGDQGPVDKLRPEWSELDIEEKRRRYMEYGDPLNQSRPALRRARQLVAESDAVGRLYSAAESARERSVAARSTGEDQVVQKHRIEAKVYEWVARLREYEDVILRAPAHMIQEPVPEEAEAAAADQGPAANAQEPATVGNAEPAPSQDAEPAPAPAVDYYALLPSFHERTTLPKNANKRQELLKLRRPVFSANVTVNWNDMLDAEYAESWPEDVRHEPMGFSRHTAPSPSQEAIADVAEFKDQINGGYRGKKWERLVEKWAVREKVKGVTERVMDAVAARTGGGREREAAEKEAARKVRRAAEKEAARKVRRAAKEERRSAAAAAREREAIAEEEPAGEGEAKPTAI